MSINTDLNVSPYFDDFDEEKNFHRILFKPAVALQARELTQLQTILQNQIERFGDNIITEGSIVSGGNFKDFKRIAYVKIRDNNTNNQPISINNYIGARIVGASTGLTAIVVTALAGLESQSPDLNTLYIRYTNTAQDAFGDDVKQFLPGEILNFTINGTVESALSVAVAPLAVDSAPTGFGYAVECGDGIIYQKGNFIRFENQITIVSKYNAIPSGVVVGFQTKEEIINSNTDTSLLDNAQGFNNEAAPGADRLKLTPILTTLPLALADADETFFAIQEYQDGRLIRRRVETQYSTINKSIEKRTAEESGNYSIGNFELRIGEKKDSDGAIDPDNLAAFISAGVAYVEGKRVEINDTLRVDVPKATDFNAVTQQDIVANYGNYVNVEDMYGSINVDSIPKIDIYDTAQTATSTLGFTPLGSKIGEAFVRTTTRSGDVYRIYLFDIKMNSGQNFANAKSFVYDADSAFGNFVLEGGLVNIKDASFTSLIFPIGKEFIKTVNQTGTDYVYRTTANTLFTANTSGSFSISLSTGETFPYGGNATLNSDQRSDIVVSLSSNGMIVPISSANTSSDAATLSATLGPTYSGLDLVVTYNAKKNDVKPIGKILQTVYLRINASANTSGPYNLGWPDVHEIVGIWKGSNTTFVETDSGIFDVKDNFTLVKNDTEDKYGISFIQRKGITIATSDRFLVKAKVFVKQIEGEFDQSFFTYDSYPIDDSSTILPEDKIRTQDISQNLRDSIDFRPYAANTAAYATDAASATIWTNASPLSFTSFGTADNKLVAPNESVEASYEYYLGRKDRLIINEKGDFVNVNGISSEEPTIPNQPKRAMTIATINIPPFPSLPSYVANRSKNPAYGVTYSIEDNRRYTMRDIGDIEQRIDRLEYYTTLSALEKSAEDLVIVDADGLNRFKNGILVDNFDTLLVGDVQSDEFSASVDKSFEELSPKFRAYDVPLKISGTSSATNHGEVVTLPYSQQVMIKQPYATNIRNCVTDFYSFPGSIKLRPEYDGSPDYTRAPDINFNVDLTKPFADFTEALSEFVPLSTVDRSVIGSRTSKLSSVVGNTRTTTTSTTTITNVATTRLTRSSSREVQKVGDFVTDVQFKPFLRANRVEVFISGMRPNTRVYPFFDGVNVSQYFRAAKLRTTPSKLKQLLGPAGPFGGVLRTDAKGQLKAIFRIPEGTFYVGDRELIIADVARLEDIDAATTISKAMYRGYNFTIEKTGLEVSTRTPSFDVNVTERVRRTTVVDVESTISPPQTGDNGGGSGEFGRRGGDFDPISQTFTVETDYSSDNAVLITSVDLFFESKDSVTGVTVQIRNVENGYPGSKILTFGEATLESSQVSVSTNGATATRFTFPAPVTLAAGEDYCIVVIPEGNSPNYRLWVSRTGERDLVTGLKVTQDTNAGTLFTSTNNKAWTPYQNENMKFTLNKALFTTKEGNLRLVPDDVEFFKIAALSGNISQGETVFVQKTPAGGSIAITNDSSTVVGTGTSFTSYFTEGDTIAFQTGSNSYEVATILSIANNTIITVDPAPSSSNTSISNYYRTVSGDVDYLNKRLPYKMHLKNSTAKAGAVFANGDILLTEQGDAAEIEEVENLKVSYFQANIPRANFTRTSTDLFTTRLFTDGGSNYSTTPINMTFNNNNYLTRNNTVIYSKSNEITSAVSNTFELRVDMKNTSKSTVDTSPVVDYDISSITAYEYFINEANTEVLDSEKTVNGLSESKYVSKVVELADGFDAEDIKVYLTAYRPTGTDVNVYVKFKNAADPTPLDEVVWTKLNLRTGSNFSSSADRFDFRELEYSLDSTTLGAGEGAYLSGGTDFTYNSGDGVIYTNFKFFAIKIVLNSSGHRLIPRIKDMRAIALT